MRLADVAAVDAKPGTRNEGSSSKVRRMSMIEDRPPTGRKGRFYTEEAVRQRMDLMKHEAILKMLELLWISANTDASDAIVDKAEYLVMHHKILLALEPQTNPREAQRRAEEDWIRDSNGKPGLDRERFYWTWFELADMYTRTMEAGEYVGFLGRMLRRLVRQEADGTSVWQEDRKIVEEYFERQRRRGKLHDLDATMPVVMSQWCAQEPPRPNARPRVAPSLMSVRAAWTRRTGMHTSKPRETGRAQSSSSAPRTQRPSDPPHLPAAVDADAAAGRAQRRYRSVASRAPPPLQ